MKPTITLFHMFVLLLATSNGSKPDENLLCYHLEIHPGTSSFIEAPPEVDDPVMFGRLSFSPPDLPVDELQSVEGRIRLVPEDGVDYFKRRRGQRSLMIFFYPSGWLSAELLGRPSHDSMTFSASVEPEADWADFEGHWEDQRGWFTGKSGEFTARLVAAPSLGACLSMD